VSGFTSWLRRFLPHPVHVSRRERIRACAGALVGIGLTFWITYWVLGPSSHIPLLIAPMGASAVLLFGAPASPLAQPWSLIGGNLVSAIIGVTCAAWIPDPGVASAVAVAASIAGMFALRCLHPPSGAVALTAVLGGPAVHQMGYQFVLLPVELNSLFLLCAALCYHRLTRHAYPHVVRAVETQKTESAEQLGFTRADLDAVLASRDEWVDVDAADLEALMRETELRAYGRRMGDLTCGNIMSTDVHYVWPSTSVETAWALLRKYSIKSLPVVDDQHRVVGIITQADFLRHAKIDTLLNLKKPLQLVASNGGADQPLTVGAIMTLRVRTVNLRQAVVDLIPLFADFGHHHLPVVDDTKQLCGMVTQADLVSGLYQARNQERRMAA
jgi:CBS domain-containing membrane protein